MADSHNLSTRQQRWIVFAALWLISAVVVWLVPVGSGSAAQAQAQDSNYQPFACTKSGGGSNRQTIDLSNDAVSGTAAGKFYPCLSGVPFRFVVGNATNFNANSDSNIVVATVTGVYSDGTKTLSWSSTGSSNLKYLAFQGLTICTGTNTPVAGCKTSVDNNDASASNDLQMYGYSSGTAAPRPLADYVLRFRPDGPITIGGSGVITDMVVTGDTSKFSVDLSQVVAGSLGCLIIGASATNNTCQGISVSAMAGVAWLTGVRNYSIRELDVTFYYLSTHAGTTTNPYVDQPMNGSSPANSLQLPNTRISVCPTTAECEPAL